MAEEELILVQGEDRKLVKEFMAQGGTPAFVVRAEAVRQTWEHLLAACRRQRDEWLAFVKMRLGRLYALAGDWPALAPLVGDAQLAVLRELHEQLSPKLRVVTPRTDSLRTLRQALVALNESLQRFNTRWREFLPKVNLAAVNEARDKYNRYYLIEKECLVGSPRVARVGYSPLSPASIKDVEAMFPLLPVFELS